MNRRIPLGALVAMACLGSMLLVVTPARADHHFIKIVEVFAGTTGFADAEYVELRMYSPGQHLVDDHHIKVYGPTGSLLQTHTFQADASDPDSQETILLATTSAEFLFSATDDYGTPDSPSSLGLDAAGGKVCFESSTLGVIDCVAWGNYTGTSLGVGPAFNPTEGIPNGAAIGRDLGSNNTLEAGDDTGNSAADFGYVTPSPDPNGAAAAGWAMGGTIAMDTISPWRAAEDAPDLRIDVRVSNQLFPGVEVQVDYATSALSATPGADYVETTGTHCMSSNCTPAYVAVPLLDDSDCERTETLRLRLRNPSTAAVLGAIIERTGQITDDDAPDEGCFLLGSSTFQVSEGNNVDVPIVRAGDLTTPGSSVRFTTTPGSASAGEFANYDDQLTFGTNVGLFEVGIQTAEDTKDEPNETFTVALSNPQPAAAILGAPTTATVTIVDDDEFKRPSSKISKPVQAKVYRRGRLVDFFGTASDTGGSGLQNVHVALRRNMTNGSCKWWTGSRWRSQACAKKLFVRASGRANWSYGLDRLLPRSRGTSTRNYTLFSRALDKAGNRETRFTRGRNMNTFEMR